MLNSVTYIDGAVFACNQLENLVIGVTSIGYQAFANNPLEEIIVIGKDSLDAFENVDELQELDYIVTI